MKIKALLADCLEYLPLLFAILVIVAMLVVTPI
jgi:hypothetical protein